MPVNKLYIVICKAGTCLCLTAHVVICPESPTLSFYGDVFCADTDLFKHEFSNQLLAQVKKQCKPQYAHTWPLDENSPLPAALRSRQAQGSRTMP